MTEPPPSPPIPPISPNADHSFNNSNNPQLPLGNRLYQAAASFYAWYQWNRKVHDAEEGFHHLQVMMQIGAKRALSLEEEEEAVKQIKALREDLNTVAKTIDQIPTELNRILDELTEANPKSRVIHHATELEMRLNLHQDDESYHKLEALIEKILVGSTKMEAEEISRQLRACLALPTPTAIQETLMNYLNTLLHKRG